MKLSCGLVGLPNVGKSTLFNALTRASAAVANYPFCTVDPNVGMVPVPDPRLAALSALFNPKKTTPTYIEFVDIAGLVKGASSGEGLGNQFLSHIREVSVIVHIVRCFDDSDIVHVNGQIDPKGDIEIIETELILKDLESVEKQLARVEKKSHSGDKEAQKEKALLEKIKNHLSSGKPSRSLAIADNEAALMANMSLLTRKPVLYVANVAESDIEKGNRYSEAVTRLAEQDKSRVVLMSGKIEAEIAALSPEEGALFLSELGISESGLPRLIHASYELLGLATFFTVGEDEVRAWTLPKETRAVESAGLIHSDIQRGFIRAEVTAYKDVMEYKTPQAIKEKGLLRLEGKEYLVADGDCIYFRFNV
ncbi:MAG: redox-regulated ATPase YchF [Nitrospirota bacterium]|mgnify:FL=1